jgi:hypothetical protein
MEDVTLTLYKVAKCGFYSEDTDRRQFATTHQTLVGFKVWTEGLDSVGESSTYTPTEDDDVLRAFCLDVRQLGHGNQWLIVTWNELAHVDDGVQVVEIASKIGAAHVSSVDVDALNIPGYPAFFFIDTRAGLVLNLRFEQRLNGSRQLQRYLEGFLRSSSEWCVWNIDDDEELLGYQDEDEILRTDVEAKFATTMKKVAGHEDMIRANVENIRKLIRKASVSPQIEEHKAFLDSAFDLAGLPINNRLKADIPFRYEFKTRMTAAKLDEVISKYNETNGSDWNDVGFTFARESQKIHWLSGSIARESIRVDVERLEGGMIDIDSLDEYLRRDIDAIVARLNED